jgi:predicted dehydrogenase
VHLFDAMRFFAGDVQTVWGISECRTRTQLRVEDTCYGVLRFASGADGCVIVDELTDYERFDLELQFEQGLIRLGFGEGLWTCQPLEFEQPWWNELAPDRLLEPSWSTPPLLCAARDLVESIEQERSPRCTSEDGRAAVEIIMALYESQLRGNAAVALPLDRPERMLDVLREQGVF